MKPSNRNSINYADYISDKRREVDNDSMTVWSDVYWSKSKKRYYRTMTGRYGVNMTSYKMNVLIRMLDRRCCYALGYDHWSL